VSSGTTRRARCSRPRVHGNDLGFGQRDFAQARRRVLVLGNPHAVAFTHAFDRLVLADGSPSPSFCREARRRSRGCPDRSLWQDANRHFWDTIVPPMVARLHAGDWVLLLSDLSHLSPLAGRGIRFAMLRGLGQVCGFQAATAQVRDPTTAASSR
jgi:hypothetical protein